MQTVSLGYDSSNRISKTTRTRDRYQLIGRGGSENRERSAERCICVPHGTLGSVKELSILRYFYSKACTKFLGSVMGCRRLTVCM